MGDDVRDFVLESDAVSAVEEGERGLVREVCHKVETGHYINFIETIMCNNCDLFFTFRIHVGSRVESTFSPLSLSNKSSFLGRGKNVFPCQSIQSPKIYAKPQLSTFLSHQNHRTPAFNNASTKSLSEQKVPSVPTV